MKTNYIFTLASLLSLLICQQLSAATVYVDQQNGDDQNDGLSPAMAVATVTQGLIVATPGDTLEISQGTYSTSTGETLPLAFSGDINIMGAGPELTVLDGELNSQVLSVSGQNAVVSVDGVAVINGMAILGGGISVNRIGAFSITNCIVKDNEGNIGGGMFVASTAEFVIDKCEFSGNNGGIGGAMQIEYVNDGDGNMYVTQSNFVENSASAGSSIHFQGLGNGNHTLNINQSQFINNNGGNNIRFQANEGLSFGLIANSLFADNSGNALNTQDASVDVVNVTFVNNGGALTGAAQPNVINSIFWDNSTELGNPFLKMGGNVSFSIVQDLEFGDYVDGGNNIDLDPMLGSDFRIKPGSPAIDMGSNMAVDGFGLTQDIDLEQRKFDLLQLNRPAGFVDIGANEIQDLIFENDFQ